MMNSYRYCSVARRKWLDPKTQKKNPQIVVAEKMVLLYHLVKELNIQNTSICANASFVNIAIDIFRVVRWPYHQCRLDRNISGMNANVSRKRSD